MNHCHVLSYIASSMSSEQHSSLEPTYTGGFWLTKRRHYDKNTRGFVVRQASRSYDKAKRLNLLKTQKRVTVSSSLLYWCSLPYSATDLVHTYRKMISKKRYLHDKTRGKKGMWGLSTSNKDGVIGKNVFHNKAEGCVTEAVSCCVLHHIGEVEDVPWPSLRSNKALNRFQNITTHTPSYLDAYVAKISIFI